MLYFIFLLIALASCDQKKAKQKFRYKPLNPVYLGRTKNWPYYAAPGAQCYWAYSREGIVCQRSSDILPPKDKQLKNINLKLKVAENVTFGEPLENRCHLEKMRNKKGYICKQPVKDSKKSANHKEEEVGDWKAKVNAIYFENSTKVPVSV